VLALFAQLDLPFVQRAAVDLVAVGLACGIVGTWVVLRDLAFFGHAVGTAAFPGLVLADGLGFSPYLGALGAAGAMAFAVSRGRGDGHGAPTALALAGALAVGVALASDVFHSGAQVDTLLFGSVLVVGGLDIAVGAGVAALALAGNWLLGWRWLASAFEGTTRRGDGLVVALVALCAVALLASVGAILASSLLVIPAATTRLVVRRLARWQAATVGLAIAEGLVGLWASLQLNAPPGATIAVLSGAVFALAALLRAAGRRRALALAAGVAVVALGGCGAGAGRRPRVVATTTELGDLTRAIAGGAVSVAQVLRPNTDPHEYEPRPDDVAATAGARLVLESGGGLDGWMDRVVREAGGSPRVVVVGDRVPLPLPAAGGGGGYDPHWWHDPRNVEAAVGVVRAALDRVDPSARARFAANARAYLRQLRALDAGIARCMRSVAPGRRKLVTDHDAFGYFARRYGIDVVGAVIPSQSTQGQPSARALARLVAVVRREHVAAVFPESSVNPRVAQAVGRETGARSNLLLYGDTLGPAGSGGATYLAMERHNADAMVRGFTAGRRGCRLGP
jgi:ABC-type Zn uptake system ZnuABC Zn-binding protein ZnuA/ABC-type Mn2+/Zn2+ transport system permease subunit